MNVKAFLGFLFKGALGVALMILLGVVLHKPAHAAQPGAFIQYGKHNTVKCSVIQSKGHFEYYVEASKISSFKEMDVVTCVGNAFQQKAFKHASSEILVVAPLLRGEIRGLRCYKVDANSYVLKMRDSIPGDLEIYVADCFSDGILKKLQKLRTGKMV